VINKGGILAAIRGKAYAWQGVTARRWMKGFRSVLPHLDVGLYKCWCCRRLRGWRSCGLFKGPAALIAALCSGHRASSLCSAPCL